MKTAASSMIKSAKGLEDFSQARTNIQTSYELNKEIQSKLACSGLQDCPDRTVSRRNLIYDLPKTESVMTKIFSGIGGYAPVSHTKDGIQSMEFGEDNLTHHRKTQFLYEPKSAVSKAALDEGATFKEFQRPTWVN